MLVSMGLVADSLDMLADSIVYPFRCLLSGEPVSRKKNIAGRQVISNWHWPFWELQRFISVLWGMEKPLTSPNDYHLLLALAGNAICL